MFDKFHAWLQNFAGAAANRLLPAAILLVVGLVVIHFLMKLVAKTLQKTKLERAAHHLVLAVVKVVLYLLLILSVADALSIDMTGLVALASVLTLAISLSLQNALSNVFGGFSLLYTKPFVSGDFVEIAGQSGTVQEIDLAYTKLLTGDNKVISLPNSSVVAAQIINYTAVGTRRVDITVTASYDAPVDLVLSALHEAAQEPDVLQEPAVFAGVQNYGDSSIEYILRFWTASSTYWDARYAVNKKIKDVFDEKGIEMTYPHLNVHMNP